MAYGFREDVALHPLPGVRVRDGTLEDGNLPGPGLPDPAEWPASDGGEGMKKEILTDEDGKPWGIAYTLDDLDNDGSELFDELTRLLGDD